MNIYSVFTDLYLIAMAIAYISSLSIYRLDIPLHLKFFSILLVFTFIVECFANFAIKPLHLGSNVPLYNCFMLVEFMAYAYYYLLINVQKNIKRLITSFLFLFPIFWYYAVFDIFTLKQWNSYVMIVGSIFTICLSVHYYYQLFTSQELIRLNRSPEFWIATGLIIFYTCNLPYFGMLNYLIHSHGHVATVFIINEKIFNTIMYSIFAYAYVCQKRIISTKS